MPVFIVVLIVGFVCNTASAFTTAYSRRLGERRGSLVTAVLRNILGIPVWAAGFVLALRAPSSFVFPPSGANRAAGIVLILAGAAVITIALVTIRLRAAVPSTSDALVRTGIYAYVRHPIHSGTFLEFLGLFLMKPSASIAAACALGVVWLFFQTKCEEIDLRKRLPGYRAYQDAVPRFFPRLVRRGAVDGRHS
jgi:protein-S-isoprenylcysteine O-methyltransferase Ste14